MNSCLQGSRLTLLVVYNQGHEWCAGMVRFRANRHRHPHKISQHIFGNKLQLEQQSRGSRPTRQKPKGRNWTEKKLYKNGTGNSKVCQLIPADNGRIYYYYWWYPEAFKLGQFLFSSGIDSFPRNGLCCGSVRSIAVLTRWMSTAQSYTWPWNPVLTKQITSNGHGTS